MSSLVQIKMFLFVAQNWNSKHFYLPILKKLLKIAFVNNCPNIKQLQKWPVFGLKLGKKPQHCKKGAAISFSCMNEEMLNFVDDCIEVDNEGNKFLRKCTKRCKEIAIANSINAMGSPPPISTWPAFVPVPKSSCLILKRHVKANRQVTTKQSFQLPVHSS